MYVVNEVVVVPSGFTQWTAAGNAWVARPALVRKNSISPYAPATKPLKVHVAAPPVNVALFTLAVTRLPGTDDPIVPIALTFSCKPCATPLTMLSLPETSTGVTEIVPSPARLIPVPTFTPPSVNAVAGGNV